MLQMQKYHSIADVAHELRKVADRKTAAAGEIAGAGDIAGEVADEKEKIEEEKVMESEENGGEGGEHTEEYDSPESEITDSGN